MTHHQDSGKQQADEVSPTMRPYGRQIFICSHGNCASPELGEQLHRQLNDLNRQHQRNKLRNPERIKVTISDCLGVCQGGPILVVYPEGIWYHHVDEKKLNRIYEEHLLGGEPVEEFIFHRLYPPQQEPPYAPQVRGDAGQWRKQEEEKLPSQTEPQTRREVARRDRKKKGLVIVNTGNGKGKTTAALGVMTRAWGRKMKIGVFQFLKNEHARFGEIKASKRMGDIDWQSMGDGWSWTSQDMDETQSKAHHGWQMVQKKISENQYDLLILDEFTYPLHYGWLDTNEVIDWLKANKPPMLHVIITGRYAPPQLIAYADLVTEMREVKHPFREQGIRAQPGIEY